MGSWFTSDLHLNHKMILSHRHFDTIEEMKEKIFSMFDVVKKGDDVFILGDIGWEVEPVQELFNYLIMKKRVANIYIIEGNHDDKWIGKVTEHPRIHYCQTMTLRAQPKNGYHAIFLSHYPSIIYDKSHHGAFQLHGHGHKDTIDRPLLDALQMGKRINVCCELNDYKLWSRDDIEGAMKKKPNNIDYVLCHGSDKDKKKVEKILKNMNSLLKKLEKIKIDE